MRLDTWPKIAWPNFEGQNFQSDFIHPDPRDVWPINEELEGVVDGKVEEEEPGQVEDEAEAKDTDEAEQLSLGVDPVQAGGEHGGDESEERGRLE